MNWFSMRLKTEALLRWLYSDPHGQGISDHLAAAKFGDKAVEEARSRGWVDGDPIMFTHLGLRALAARRGARRRRRSR